MKKLKKKGIFLTFIAISLIAAFIIIFTPSDINLKKDIPVIKTRVSNVNEYVVDLENVYLERTLQSSGIKTINALIEYMEVEKIFLTNFGDVFEEVLMYGTVDGAKIDSFIEPDIMADNTYINWTNQIINVSEDAFNVDTNITVNGIQAYQIRPWFLNVDANVSFSVSSETALWNKDVIITTEIDIQRFEDPYYLVNTIGTATIYRNRINKSVVKFNEWDVDKVKDHIRHGTYVHVEDSKAPNFIMRFTNTSLNSSCCGIESLADPNELSKKDQMESYVDYLFFNHTYQHRCDELYNVTALWDEFNHFKLEFEHLVLYNLIEANVVKAC